MKIKIRLILLGIGLFLLFLAGKASEFLTPQITTQMSVVIVVNIVILVFTAVAFVVAAIKQS